MECLIHKDKKHRFTIPVEFEEDEEKYIVKVLRCSCGEEVKR